MPRRPIVIIIIAICYFIAPAAFLVYNSLTTRHPLFGPQSLFSSPYLGEILVLVIYPLSAVALLSVKKWGWYLFLGCSAALIAYNTGSYVVHPRYSLFILVLVNIALVVVAGIVFHKHVIAPYFNPRLRWWETEPRFRVEAYAQIKMGEAIVSGEILDISRSGCFATFILDLPIGKTYKMHLKCLRHVLDIDGKVMRKATKGEPHEGYGFMFAKMTAEQRKEVGLIIEELERGDLRDYIRDHEIIPSGIVAKKLYKGVTETAPRYNVRSKVILTDEKGNYLCRMVDISRTGCFVTSDHELEERSKFKVKIDCLKTKLSVDGKIERKVVQDGEKGYGIRFLSMTRQKQKSLQNLLGLLRKIGAEDRIESAKPALEWEIDSSVRNTPYKMVLFFKKRLTKIGK